MKKRILLILVTSVVLLSIVLTGCSSGIPQADYDKVAAQLADAQSQLTQAQSDLAAAQGDQAALTTAQAQVTDLQKQVNDLLAQVTLTGATDAETAQNIIEYYASVHYYQEDIYDCNDMSGDVWDMLNAAGIYALLAIGNIDYPITDIAQSNHAWVLAEVAPGEFLALETTRGYTVPRSENGGYYRGWTFQTPADVVAYHELVAQYNEGLTLRNTLSHAEEEYSNLYNEAVFQGQTDASKYQAVRQELTTLRTQLETDLLNLKAQYEALATPIN